MNELLEQLDNNNDSISSKNQIDTNIEINNELDPLWNKDPGLSLIAFNRQQWTNTKIQLRALIPTGDT